jgi:alkylation response protein AidB-like acyl-CoA dehydrogenase
MSQRTGGSFLIEDHPAAEIFAPEDLTQEHRAVARAAREFFEKEVEPAIPAMIDGDYDRAVALLRKGAELGFASILTPEQYGGMELDLASSLVVAEELARDGSFAGWHGAHAGIGTLPILLFGTEDQKEKYLPKLSSAELIAAYALTESHAGSDALAVRTRADLSADGTHYILNGQKMWITNGGRADLFTVFAKINGEQFSAFLVEKSFPGVSIGKNEHKMGIRGSSTTAVFFDNVPVPLENLLGEPGRGHIIAFNILNLGRLKLGPFSVGASKNVLRVSLAYAKERKAFGSEIASFGVIRHKLAEMAIRIFAAESISYRVEGLIAARLENFSWAAQGAAQAMMSAIEEFAAECSIVKVFATEALAYVTDEGVQIHGGNGYHQDYLVERAYRDARINRIFEGTNEINRLLVTGMLLKRARQNRLPLAKAAKALMDEVLAGPQADQSLVAGAKKTALLLLSAAFEKFGAAMDQQQEVLSGIADAIIEAFAMESVQLRARKTGRGEDIAAVFLCDAMARIEATSRTVLAACCEGDTLRRNLAILRRFAKYEPVNAIALRRNIAAKLLAAGQYVV